jgi:hypothetical protein
LAAALAAAGLPVAGLGFIGDAAIGLAAALGAGLAAAGVLAGAAGCPATVWLAGALGLLGVGAGVCAIAIPATNIIAAIMCVAFMVTLDYFLAGAAGALAGAAVVGS